MEFEATVIEVKKLLAQLLESGKSQSAELIELKRRSGPEIRHNLPKGVHDFSIGGIYVPVGVGVATILSDQDLFLARQIQSYWEMFESILDIIDHPVVQFPLRTSIEIVISKILFFSIGSETERKQRTIKQWLCVYGLVAPSDNNAVPFTIETYDALVAMLQDGNEKLKFNDIKMRGFPFDDLHVALHKIFPSPTNQNLLNTVQPILNELWKAKKVKVDLISKTYRYLSNLIHGEPTSIKQLEMERGDFTHMFRSANILVILGLTVILFTERQWGIRKNDEDFERLNRDFAKLMPLLSKLSRLRQSSK